MATQDTAVSLQEKLFRISQTYVSAVEQQQIVRAYTFAEAAHRGFSRKDGTPYIDHPTAVACQLAAWHAPSHVVISALFHDILKENYATNVSLSDIESHFGQQTASLVDDIARLGRYGAPYSADIPNTMQERMAYVTAQLPWVAIILQRSPLAVVVKIADKLHNFQSLQVLSEDRQIAFATGVMSIFVPFAERLGMRAAKRNLEDAAFAILQPEKFKEMQERYAINARTKATQSIIERIKTELTAQQIAALVSIKHRSFFDMNRLETEKKKEIPLHLADPVIIITTQKTDCYRAMGAIHALWSPKPSEIWDYIAAPKPNGYRGLHSQLHYQDGEWLVTAIRDLEMDVAADYGLTAKWQGVPVQVRFTIPAWQEPPSGSIGVLTPDGDFLTLPQGSTPVDFAYAIHIGLGHHCTGALVNGRHVPLDWQLESGDVVRVLTGKANVGPSRDWLSFVQTNRARNAIRRWLKDEKPEDAAENGWRLLDEQLRRNGLTLSTPQTMSQLVTVAKNLNFPSRNRLLLAVGLGEIEAARVEEALQNSQKDDEGPPNLQATIVSLAEADMPQRLAACCRPAPPDAIVGYVTKSGNVTIHRANCHQIKRLRPLIQADWPHIDIQPKTEIQLQGVDRPGLVRDVSTLVAASGISMISFHADRMTDGSALINIGLEEVPRWQLDRLVSQLNGIEDIRQVEPHAPTLSAQVGRKSVLARHFDNPYTLRPVTGKSFYGRRKELKELINNLRDVRPGEAVLLWGPRRIGKTSLLLEFKQQVMSSDDYVLVFVDMQRLSGRSTTMFIRDILRAIANVLDNTQPPKLTRLRRDPLGYFRSFLENAPQLQNKHLVLIIDEFQLLPHLKEEEISLADLNRAFRSIIQHRGGLSIIFSGGGVLDTLLKQPDASFMLEVARYQKIDCLDETAARQLIIEPSQRVVFGGNVVDRLLAETARHPYYLQWLCGELIARADRDKKQTIDQFQLDRLLTEWLPIQGEQFFNHLWGSSTGFSPEQQYLSKLVLTALATKTAVNGWLPVEKLEAILKPYVPDTSQIWFVLQDLAQMDTLNFPEDGRYTIKMPLFQKWLTANMTVERVVKENKRQ